MPYPTNIKMVAIDLDGTLLNSNHELSTKTIETLKLLSKSGTLVCIATGRSTASVQFYTNILKLDIVLPCVCFNGAVGVKLKAEESFEPEQIFMDCLNTDKAMKLLELANKEGMVAQYYNGLTSEIQAVPIQTEHKELMGRYASLVGASQTELDDYSTAIDKSQACKILILTHDVDRLIQLAQDEFGKDSYHIIRGSPDPFFVEFLNPGVCKGSGLEKLCTAINIPLECVVAFGDGDNDKEMLKTVGHGVAMKNARDITKICANKVLDLTNDEDGVACYIEELMTAGAFS
jgi:5-amino-6-(5-phospho-D-ribitylamino)uracil phosphatase